MAEFRMPALGADMTEGTLLEWLVKPGDAVHRGDIIAVVDTDKAAIEIEVFDDGVMDELLIEPGTKVPVGTVLATIGAAGAPSHQPAEKPPAPEAPVAPPAPSPAVESPLVRHLAHVQGVDLTGLAGSGPGGAITRHDLEVAVAPTAPPRLRASPRAKRLASQRGVDLSTVAGTGPGGAVTAGDLDRLDTGETTAAQPRHEAGPEPTRRAASATADRLSAMRAATAALMARSKREIPHFYVSTTLDVSPATDWLARANTNRPVSDRLVMAAPMLKAAALAARAVPDLNGFWVDDAFQPSEHVHLGIAVSLRGGGLVAPAILDADQLPIDVLMQQLRDLVGRARAGRLRQREMSSGTITVTNLGDNGAEAVFGVIYPPQVGLVGLGRVVERPWAHDGMVGARPTVTLTLSADHRAGDGHICSRYLAAFAELLGNPEEL